ncbi:hypothetical protein WA026_011715 [Henosepilachna vigintioctopunctata]|uniref:RNA polymerase II-associated protein 3 n=1 Tax=Henosepilachna vigintioctopunctata TaxID=420089 RepID=A0AAW1UL44_9CUCU
MDPVLLQQQLKNNNKDLLDFCQDLKSWGEEMQKKDPKSHSEAENKKFQDKPYSNKKNGNINKKDNVGESNQPKRKCMTYSDWEKFDADKECDKIDDSDSELTDEFDENMKEEALVLKDKGNLFVKNGNWDEAIKCYTKAIEYFAYDPVFFANRGLCYLKKNEMKKVEDDCTISIKLDNTYVKAYQRRAAARESMNKLDDAKLDLLKVLQLEPNNPESKNRLAKLIEKIKSSQSTDISSIRPVSNFTASRQQKNSAVRSQPDKIIVDSKESGRSKIDVEKPAVFWPSGDNVPLVKAIKKPPHLRSKKPLKRIQIEEINSVKPTSPTQPNVSSWPRIGETSKTIKIDDFKIIEHKHPDNNCEEEENVSRENEQNIKQTIYSPESKKNAKNINNLNVFNKNKEQLSLTKEKAEDIELFVPTTSVQFHSMWKRLKDLNEKKYQYLKMLNPQNIPELFKESLESHIFSDILLILANHFTGENDEIYEYLLYLTKIKRFGALIMFLTLNDKNCLWRMFNRIKECEGKSKEVDELIGYYEL